MFYLMTHSTHFIYGYMASDIWLRTILIVRKETRCHHIVYSYRLTARVLLYTHTIEIKRKNRYETGGGGVKTTKKEGGVGRGVGEGFLRRQITYTVLFNSHSSPVSSGRWSCRRLPSRTPSAAG